MRQYGYLLFISFSVLLLGCDNHESVRVEPKVKKHNEPVPIRFGYLPYGEYKVSLKQTHTKTITTTPQLAQTRDNPLIVESYTEWNLTHKDDYYQFNLVDLHYEYEFPSHILVFDTRTDRVAIENKINGVAVSVTDKGKQDFATALESLKKVKGFSFSLGRDTNLAEGTFDLISSYQLLSDSFQVVDNPYSPHEEIELHLGKEKIIPIFTMMMARPLKPMIANEKYESDLGNWTLSSGADRLTYELESGDVTRLIVNKFDRNNRLKSSYFRSVSSTKQKTKFGGIIRKYVHEAEVVLTLADSL